MGARSISHMLAKSAKPARTLDTAPPRTLSWRVSKFHPPEGKAEFEAGSVSFSPAWFMQAQTVRNT